MLILAAAARAEMAAFRFDAFQRRFLHSQQFRPRKILFDLRDFSGDGFADQHERHEHHEVIHAPDAFAAERDVVDCQGNLVADFERHARKLKILAGRKKSFHLATAIYLIENITRAVHHLGCGFIFVWPLSSPVAILTSLAKFDNGGCWDGRL